MTDRNILICCKIQQSTLKLDGAAAQYGGSQLFYFWCNSNFVRKCTATDHLDDLVRCDLYIQLTTQACTQEGLRGFDRTPYFCSLKLILSLNIKYCMIMCAIVCRNLHLGIFNAEISLFCQRLGAVPPHSCILDCLLDQMRTPLLKSLRTGLQL